MNDDQFTKLFKYIEEFRSEVNGRLEYLETNIATKASIDDLIDTIDSFVKRLDDAEVEQAARDAQFARLIEWAKEVSKKTGVPLPDF